MQIYIGYDDREDTAFQVCKKSILRHTKNEISITPLRHMDLRNAGLFTRPWMINHKGQWIDLLDGKPFSTQFSHSRFLTPRLGRHDGISGWVMYVDCDFLFFDDVEELFRLCDSNKGVMVVKHNYTPENTQKKEGAVQSQYPKKLWSSLMLFNLQHPSIKTLDAEMANRFHGDFLHQFRWIKESAIGALPEEWNWIPGHSKGKPKAVHFTEGLPNVKGYENVEYAREWLSEV